MKKFSIILFLALLIGFVSAQCSEYINLAEGRLAPPYPNYFGAAGEYDHAAECYEAEGNLQNANTYYSKAAQHYIIAADLLVEGADYFQKAKSYEFAADAFFKIRDRDSATTYYQKAIDVYGTHGFPQEASTLSALVTQKFSPVSPEKQNPTSNWSGIALPLIVIALIGLSFFLRSSLTKPKSRLESSSPRSTEPPVRRPSLGTFAEEPRRPQTFTPPIQPSNQSGGTQPLSPKEKLARKLREKYSPKY